MAVKKYFFGLWFWHKAFTIESWHFAMAPILAGSEPDGRLACAFGECRKMLIACRGIFRCMQ